MPGISFYILRQLNKSDEYAAHRIHDNKLSDPTTQPDAIIIYRDDGPSILLYRNLVFVSLVGRKRGQLVTYHGAYSQIQLNWNLADARTIAVARDILGEDHGSGADRAMRPI